MTALKLIGCLEVVFIIALAVILSATRKRRQVYVPPLMRPCAGGAVRNYRPPMIAVWASLAMWGLIIAGCVAVAGCGGGGDGAVAAAVASTPPPASTPPATTTTSLPVCSPGVTSAFKDRCACPAGDITGLNPTPSCAVPCPDGQTVNGSGICVADTPPAPPVTPPPTPCPTGYTFTGAGCTPPPAASVTLAYVGGLLSWNSVNATVCELGPNGGLSQVALTGAETPPSEPDAVTYTLVCGNVAGNAEVSVSVPGTVAPPPPPPTPAPPPPAPPFTITLASSANPITDSTGCPQDFNAVPCVASLTITDSLGTESQDSCTLNGGTPQAGSVGWSVGPYANDGPEVFTVACTSTYGQASASITLTVIQPDIPPPDTFSEVPNGDGTYTFNWFTASAQGAGGCTVQLLNNSGVDFSPSGGGTPSGSVRSAFLSPSGDPWTATLICSGAPDHGVPAITVSP